MGDNYKPYGPEWKAEMMRLTKKELVAMLKSVLTGKHDQIALRLDRMESKIDILANVCQVEWGEVERK